MFIISANNNADDAQQVKVVKFKKGVATFKSKAIPADFDAKYLTWVCAAGGDAEFGQDQTLDALIA